MSLLFRSAVNPPLPSPWLETTPPPSPQSVYVWDMCALPRTKPPKRKEGGVSCRRRHREKPSSWPRRLVLRLGTPPPPNLYALQIYRPSFSSCLPLVLFLHKGNIASMYVCFTLLNALLLHSFSICSSLVLPLVVADLTTADCALELPLIPGPDSGECGCVRISERQG